MPPSSTERAGPAPGGAVTAADKALVALAFDRAANERLLVAGVHLPFPGLGYVTRGADGQGYRFEPAPWLPL